MPSDFSMSGRIARDAIPVPALAMDAIRLRSHRGRARGRARTIAACAALSLGAVGVGVGAKIYDGVHVWLAGGKVSSVFHSGVLMRQPTASDLQAAIAHATFPIVFPVGVPAGSRVNMVTLGPIERPSAITISYQNAASGFKASFVLLDPAVVDTEGAVPPAGSVHSTARAAYHWRVGGEVVVVRADGISQPDLDAIKAAMAASSPSASLAATLAMLPTITVLGGTVRLDAAERLTPPNGRGVLLDEASVRSIAGLVAHGKPILDWRLTYLDKIEYRNGDLSKAVVVRRPPVIAIPTDGVRAIDAVLRTPALRGKRAACGCEILFHQPSRSAYWVWVIPMSPSASGRKFAVDATTFAVAPLGVGG